MELEKAVKEMLTKMDDTEVDNIKNYCEISVRIFFKFRL